MDSIHPSRFSKFVELLGMGKDDLKGDSKGTQKIYVLIITYVINILMKYVHVYKLLAKFVS